MGGARITAILLAGRRPGIDPLAEHFKVEDKALIEVAGEAMLSRVARTLLADDRMERLILLAQDSSSLARHPQTRWLAEDRRVALETCGDSIAGAIEEVLRQHPNGYPFLVTTADNPLLDPAIIAAFVQGAAGADLAVGLVERRTLLATFPESRRTWLPFRNGAYSGANLFWLRSPKALPALGVWRVIEQDRKKSWRVIGAFGPLMLLAALLRLLTIRQAFGRIGRRYGMVARPVVLPFAEACIDVDKPADHALVTAILERRTG